MRAAMRGVMRAAMRGVMRTAMRGVMRALLRTRTCSPKSSTATRTRVRIRACEKTDLARLGCVDGGRVCTEE
eukprot:2616932-Pleurochrysis_carterae.AAC.1